MKTMFDTDDDDYGAIFSEGRVYRYLLWRKWDRTKPAVAFVGLNPSTADEAEDDPTIRRCIGYAKDGGCGTLFMLNLFAFCATDPAVMKAAADPTGPENDSFLYRFCANGSTVAAWGAHGSFRGRSSVVRSLFPDMLCLGQTKSGEPKHPLYLRRETTPRKFREMQT